MSADPRLIYTERLQQRRASVRASESRHRTLGNVRLATAGAALVLVWLALVSERVSILWTGVPIAVFAVLVVLHERLLKRLAALRRAATYYQRALARLDGLWAGTGEPGDGYAAAEHLYAQDLDLFGKGSVFELLCTARTHIGEDRLARWLLAPAPPEQVLARQAAVTELRPAVDLREDLAVLAEEARTSIDPMSLAAWAEAPPLLTSRRIQFLATSLSIFGGLGLIAGFVWLLSLAGLPVPFAGLLRDFYFLTLVTGAIFVYRTRRPLEEVVAAVEQAAHNLSLFSAVLVRIEQETFASPLLVRLRASLDTGGAPPSVRIARLNRLMEMLDSRDNVLVRLLDFSIFWTLHVAIRIEKWRLQSGSTVRSWLDATGEMEALCSLASFAFEHPADPFPEFVAGGAYFEADAIAHPLIPEDQAVRNDLHLGGDLRVLVVSGSNMSGKSTLLRTIGVNAVLAQAGAPVRARRLRLSPLQVGAAIRVTDSLQGHMSRFYAEIVRLRHILDATSGPGAVLFLLDEFLHGTNSHDRRVGAEALVRGLVERGAIGLVTTHDLALADIAASLDARAANVHFEDHLENGRMTFDYIMRPGVVTKSNAIELMRSVGLEI
jgi:hypothetical protein